MSQSTNAQQHYISKPLSAGTSAFNLRQVRIFKDYMHGYCTATAHARGAPSNACEAGAHVISLTELINHRENVRLQSTRESM